MKRLLITASFILGIHVSLQAQNPVRVVKPAFPTSDYVITGYHIDDFGIQGNSGKDVSKEFNQAIAFISEHGGGTLWAPAGRYRFDGAIQLRKAVTIRGDWQQPQSGNAAGGTVFEVYAGRGNAQGEPFINMDRATGLIGITIWYPEQNSENIIPYPYTLYQSAVHNATVKNVTLVNSYQGFSCGPTINTLHFFQNVYATCLWRGFDIDGTADIGRLENVHLSPRFWEQSGLPGAPGKNSLLRRWMYDNAIGLTVKRNDWSYMFNVQVEGCHIGYCTRRTRCPENLQSGDIWYANGQNYGLRFTGCKTAMDFEDTGNVGTIYAKIQIKNAEVGLHFQKTFQETVQFNRLHIEASRYAVHNEGAGWIQMQACEFARGQVLMERGGITILDSDFKGAQPQIVFGKDVLGASILSNRFRQKPHIAAGDGLAGDNILIDHTQRGFPRMPDYPYQPATEDFKPKSDKVFVVTDVPFNAQGDSQTDDTEAFEKALDQAARKGGTVYVPAGRYKISRALIIAQGVELRGVFDVPHHASGIGSVLYICCGKGSENGTPFVRLKGNCGLRGITFHYPDQDYRDPAAYPYMLQGMGKDIYIINVTSTFPYKMLDMYTYRCDNHYLEYIQGVGLKESIRIGGGSKNGRVYNCQINPHNFTQTHDYENGLPSEAVLSQQGSSIQQEVENFHRYLFKNHDAFVFGDCVNERMHQNFVFGARRGLAFVDEHGKGANGYCFGHASDQCTYPVYVEKLGTNNPPKLMNIQAVTIEQNGADRAYLKLADAFGQRLEIFNLNAWGNPHYACVVENGRLQMQLAHFAHCSRAGVYKVGKGSLELVNCYAKCSEPLLAAGQDSGRISVIGNIVGQHSKDMATHAADSLPGKVIWYGNIKSQPSDITSKNKQ